MHHGVRDQRIIFELKSRSLLVWVQYPKKVCSAAVRRVVLSEDETGSDQEERK